jgi:hypothetical protein
MARKLRIIAGDVKLNAELYDTPTAVALKVHLPLEGKANVWGEEIYIDVDSELALEPDSRVELEVGDLAYWPAGPAICVFFGPTPVSIGEQPAAFSPVNVFGRVTDDTEPLKKVPFGSRVRFELAE